jgi:hypothetical protein
MLPAFGGSAVFCPPKRPPPPVPAAPNAGVFEPEPALLDVFPNKELPPCGAVDGVPLLDAPEVNENILGDRRCLLVCGGCSRRCSVQDLLFWEAFAVLIRARSRALKSRERGGVRCEPITDAKVC